MRQSKRQLKPPLQVKNVAIMCCGGIGDSLLMMIVARHFRDAGYQVTVFGDSIDLVAPFFTGYAFAVPPPLVDLEAKLAFFDRVIVQNDHSERAYFLFDLRGRRTDLQILFLFPTFCPRWRDGDLLFDRAWPMATNLAAACCALLGKEKGVSGQRLCLSSATVATLQKAKKNGILLPKGNVYRRFPKRIVFHPTSKAAVRNWNQRSYLKLAHQLRRRGCSIAFAVSPEERAKWLFVEREGITLPAFSTLNDVGAYLYESGFFIGNDSGLGHLASNLGVATLTISGDLSWVRLWRPDWTLGALAVPYFPLPNFKGIGWRFRERRWSYFVPVSRALRAFDSLKNAWEQRGKTGDVG
ncbi:MAG: glycosyltransferase family 9 protein [Chlamydiota bacterium]